MCPQLSFTLDFRRLDARHSVYGVSIQIIGAENSSVMDPEQFLSCWYGKVPYRINSDLRYDPSRWHFSSRDEDLLHYLKEASGGYIEVSGKFLYYSCESLTGLLVLLHNSQIGLYLEGDRESMYTVDSGIRELLFTLSDMDEGAIAIDTSLSFEDESVPLESLRLLPSRIPWGIVDDKIVRLRFSAAAGIKQAMSDHSGHTHLEVAKDGATFVLDELLPFLHERGMVALQGRLKQAIKESDSSPGTILRVDMVGLDIRVECLFRYGNKRIDWSYKGGLIRTSDYRWRQRDYQYEQSCLDQLVSASFIAQPEGVFLLQNEREIFRFIYEFLPSLQGKWRFYIAADLRKLVKNLKSQALGSS